jgi:hypothetical protein
MTNTDRSEQWLMLAGGALAGLLVATVGGTA